MRTENVVLTRIVRWGHRYVDMLKVGQIEGLSEPKRQRGRGCNPSRRSGSDGRSLLCSLLKMHNLTNIRLAQVTSVIRIISLPVLTLTTLYPIYIILLEILDFPKTTDLSNMADNPSLPSARRTFYLKGR